MFLEQHCKDLRKISIRISRIDIAPWKGHWADSVGWFDVFEHKLSNFEDPPFELRDYEDEEDEYDSDIDDDVSRYDEIQDGDESVGEEDLHKIRAYREKMRYTKKANDLACRQEHVVHVALEQNVRYLCSKLKSFNSIEIIRPAIKSSFDYIEEDEFHELKTYNKVLDESGWPSSWNKTPVPVNFVKELQHSINIAKYKS